MRHEDTCIYQTMNNDKATTCKLWKAENKSEEFLKGESYIEIISPTSVRKLKTRNYFDNLTVWKELEFFASCVNSYYSSLKYPGLISYLFSDEFQTFFDLLHEGNVDTMFFDAFAIKKQLIIYFKPRKSITNIPHQFKHLFQNYNSDFISIISLVSENGDNYVYIQDDNDSEIKVHFPLNFETYNLVQLIKARIGSDFKNCVDYYEGLESKINKYMGKK